VLSSGRTDDVLRHPEVTHQIPVSANQGAFLFNRAHHPAGGKAFMQRDFEGILEPNSPWNLHFLCSGDARQLLSCPRLLLNTLLMCSPAAAARQDTHIHIPSIKAPHCGFCYAVKIMINI